MWLKFIVVTLFDFLNLLKGNPLIVKFSSQPYLQEPSLMDTTKQRGIGQEVSPWALSEKRMVLFTNMSLVNLKIKCPCIIARGREPPPQNLNFVYPFYCEHHRHQIYECKTFWQLVCCWHKKISHLKESH